MPFSIIFKQLDVRMPRNSVALARYSKIRDLHSKGLSTPEIAEKTGFDALYVYNSLQRMGLKSNKIGDVGWYKNRIDYAELRELTKPALVGRKTVKEVIECAAKKNGVSVDSFLYTLYRDYGTRSVKRFAYIYDERKNEKEHKLP